VALNLKLLYHVCSDNIITSFILSHNHIYTHNNKTFTEIVRERY